MHKNVKTKYHKIAILAPLVIIFLTCNGLVNTGWPGISFVAIGARKGKDLLQNFGKEKEDEVKVV